MQMDVIRKVIEATPEELVEQLKKGEISHAEYMLLVDQRVKEAAEGVGSERKAVRSRRIKELARTAREI